MRRIGGLLILVGSVGFGVLLAFALAGQTIDTSENSLTSGIILGSAACWGLGSGLLALDGSGNEGGLSRVALGLVAAALLGLVAIQLWLVVSPIQGDLLASPLVYGYIAGYLALLIGQIVIGLAFIFRGWPRLLTGWLCLAGLLALLLSASVVSADGVAPILRVGGFVSLLVGWFTLGIVALRRRERPETVPTGSAPNLGR
jgi:hypothetical protein